MSWVNNKYSDTKIFGHPEKIKAFREDRITAPIYVRIKPTNRCNHGCGFCAYSDGTIRPLDAGKENHLQTGMHETMRVNDEIPASKLYEILDDLRDMGTKAVTFSGGGEPLIHPHISQVLDYARTEAGLDISIITNGQSLNDMRIRALIHAKWVRVSMDYVNGEQMAKSRNVKAVSFDRVMSNLFEFAQIKSVNCDLGINFIVTRENHADLVPFASTLKHYGVDNVRFSPVYCQGFQEYHAPIAEKVRVQLTEIQKICDDSFSVNSTYDINNPSKLPFRPFHRCRYQETVPVIGSDLGVYRCHNQAYAKDGLIGSLRDQSFRQLWESKEAQDNMRSFDPSVPCSKIECANFSKVVLFNSIAESSFDSFV